jgi:hypothetical protein
MMWGGSGSHPFGQIVSSRFAETIDTVHCLHIVATMLQQGDQTFFAFHARPDPQRSLINARSLVPCSGSPVLLRQLDQQSRIFTTLRDC